MRNSHHGRCRRHHYHLHHDQQQCHDKFIPELAGAIFMCNNETRNECFSHRIMGLPACRERFVRQVKDGMFLFLFDTDDRKMFGVFKATSDGGMNIVPEAYSSSGSTFPAQVQRLLVLFEEKKVRGVPQPIADRWGPSSSDLPLKRCYAYQQHGSMSNTDTLSQNIHKRIRNTNPNTEAAVVSMNSDMNSPTPRNINLSREIDMNVVRTQTRICRTGNGDPCQYTNDPAQQGVQNSSSLHLAQQKAQFVYCTGTGNCVACAQKLVPDMACNSCLLRQTPHGLHVNPDDQQITLSAHDHLNLSPSQAAQLYAPHPSYPENIEKIVCTCSNFYGRSRLQDQVYNSGSQDIDQKKSVFLRLARNPQRKTWETESSQTCVHPTMNQSGHRMQQLSHRAGNRAAARWPRPFYSKPAVQYQETVHTNGLSGAYADAAPDPAVEVDGIDLDSTSPLSNSTVWPSETQIHIVNFKNRNGGSKLCIELKGDLKERKIFRSKPMNAYSEAEPDPDVADGMELHPTASSSNSTAEHSETQIPFVNFNRRNGISKLRIEPKGDNKKRRFIRPSLELEYSSSHLQVLEGPVQVAINLNDPLNKPSLVSTESALDGRSMVITDTTDVKAQVDSEKLALLQGSICKSMGTGAEEVDTPHEGFQCNHEGQRVLLDCVGIETERDNPDLGTSISAESLATSLDQRRDESNEILVSIENESKKLKQDLKESKVFLFTSEACLDKLQISKVETGNVAETKSDGPQMILVTGPEKSDAFKFNETGLNISEDKTELLLIEKTDKNNPVSNPEPIDSQPITEIKDMSMLEHEPDYSKISLCLDNEVSNQVEECINLEPKANNSETSQISCRNRNPVEEYITLESETDLEMVIFSFSQNSIPVEDYISLE